LGYFSILTVFFFQTQKHVAEQGRKDLFAVNNNLNGYFLNSVTQNSVFDT